MPTFDGCKAINAKIAFALPESSDAKLINCEVEGADAAYYVYGSAAEVESLLSAISRYPQELEDLREKLNSYQNLLHVDKECLIRDSSLFKILSGTASAAGIIDFLIKYFIK